MAQWDYAAVRTIQFSLAAIRPDITGRNMQGTRYNLGIGRQGFHYWVLTTSSSPKVSITNSHLPEELAKEIDRVADLFCDKLDSGTVKRELQERPLQDGEKSERSNFKKKVVPLLHRVCRGYRDDEILCVGNTALELVRYAANDGWETTGQVPGDPGPTGITMMRRRKE